MEFSVGLLLPLFAASLAYPAVPREPGMSLHHNVVLLKSLLLSFNLCSGEKQTAISIFIFFGRYGNLIKLATKGQKSNISSRSLKPAVQNLMFPSSENIITDTSVKP